MAVDQPNSSSATGRRFKVGSNVVISVVLVAGIVVVMQNAAVSAGDYPPPLRPSHPS